MTYHSLSALILGLRSVAGCMSKDNSRYAIAGVLVEPAEDGLRLVATDGHCLAIAFVPAFKIEGLTRPVILSGEAIRALTARRATTKGRMEPDIQINHAGVAIRHETGVSRFKHVAGQFPPYRGVIPSQVAPHLPPPPVSPALLAAVTAWAAESGGFKLFSSGGVNKAVLVLDPRNPNWLAVLMPINVPDADIWTEADAGTIQVLLGKKTDVLETGATTTRLVVAGTVGSPVRRAA